MCSIASFLITLVVCTAVAFAQEPSPTAVSPLRSTTASSDSDVIQKLEDEWLKAERTTDPAALERILADDFVNLSPNGLAPGKQMLIQNWQTRAGQAPPYAVETSDMRIFVFDNTAVAAYTKTYTAKENGKVIHEDTTHVFTRDRGIWKLRASRSSFHQ
jgi:ketosteroid isomerase-like protein